MPAVPLAQIAVHLRPQDNVAVVAKAIAAGTELDHQGTKLTVPGRIVMGHKVALKPIKKGEAVYKYGQIIGFASKEIAPGEWVHVQNVSADVFERENRGLRVAQRGQQNPGNSDGNSAHAFHDTPGACC